MECTRILFVLWLCAFIAMLAEYDDPVFKVLAMVSAVLRVIGNSIKLLKNIGGMLMKISNIFNMKLAYVVETLLVVGNLGDTLSRYWLWRIG